LDFDSGSFIHKPHTTVAKPGQNMGEAKYFDEDCREEQYYLVWVAAQKKIC